MLSTDKTLALCLAFSLQSKTGAIFNISFVTHVCRFLIIKGMIINLIQKMISVNKVITLNYLILSIGYKPDSCLVAF
jgi:hypothetical protein